MHLISSIAEYPNSYQIADAPHVINLLDWSQSSGYVRYWYGYQLESLVVLIPYNTWSISHYKPVSMVLGYSDLCSCQILRQCQAAADTYFKFSSVNCPLQVSISEDATLPEKVAYTIEDANVAEALLDLYLGENTITPSTLTSVADGIAAAQLV